MTRLGSLILFPLLLIISLSSADEADVILNLISATAAPSAPKEDPAAALQLLARHPDSPSSFPFIGSLGNLTRKEPSFGSNNKAPGKKQGEVDFASAGSDYSYDTSGVGDWSHGSGLSGWSDGSGLGGWSQEIAQTKEYTFMDWLTSDGIYVAIIFFLFGILPIALGLIPFVAIMSNFMFLVHKISSIHEAMWSSIHSPLEQSFCSDCFPQSGETISPSSSSGSYKIDIYTAALTNWLHVAVKKTDGPGRMEGVVVEAIDQDGFPVGRFGLFNCKDDSKWLKLTRQVLHNECDMPNPNLIDQPSMACLYQPSNPPAEVHLSWRFAQLDQPKIKSVQFIALVVESFERNESYGNIRSPVVNIHETTEKKFAKKYKDWEAGGRCHIAHLEPQFSTSAVETINLSSVYTDKIKKLDAL